MKLRLVHLGLLLALLAAGAVLHFARREPPSVAKRAPLRPLEIIPPGAAFVLSADLIALRRSELARRVFAERLRSVAAAPLGCGLDPVNDLDEIVVAVPNASDLGRELSQPFASGALAVLAGGRFRASAVAGCAEAAIRARGGDPVRTPIGSFIGVRDRKRGAAEIVARDGVLVVSEGPYLRALLDAADGHGQKGSDLERTRDRLHGELRRRMGENTPIRATLSLLPGWLEQALGEPEAGASPLSKLRSAAIGVELGSALSVRGLLVSETASDSAALEGLLRSLARDANLGSVWMRANGVELELRADVPEATVETLLRAQGG